MNNDLISREALKDYARTVLCEDSVTNASLIRIVDEIIDNAPTVPQVTVCAENADEKIIEELKTELERVINEVRPQGEWIFRQGVTCGGYYKCNKCGEVERAEKNFCPNCGADMRGDK